MQVQINPAVVRGSIMAPASKSAMQRACAAALLRNGTTYLFNYGISADDEVALRIIQQLGALVKKEGDYLLIESGGVQPKSSTINCGESGLSSRMFTSIAALSTEPISLVGEGSLLTRPFSFFTDVLPKLAVTCSSNNGVLPLRVQGPLQPKDIEVDGSLSSQFLTGLLFAFSAVGASNVTISVRNLNSKPYIDLTLQVMKDFGLPVPVNKNYEAFIFTSGQSAENRNEPLTFHVEGDWSSAAFLLVAAAVSGELDVTGLDVFSSQADKAILEALMQTGVTMSVEEKKIHIKKNELKAFHFNATQCPDLFPPLVALAAYCGGKSVIEGVHRLAHKESNRALTLQQEFTKMGVVIQLQDDLMIVEGGGEVLGADVHSHHDHRIAMACAVAALAAKGSTTVNGAEAVNKSYPQFWEHLAFISKK